MKKQESRAALGARFLRGRWIRVLLFAGLALTAAAIFAFSAQVGEVSGRMSDLIVNFIVRTVEGDAAGLTQTPAEVYDFVSHLVRKAAHFVEFAALGFFLRLLAGSYGLRRPTRRCFLAGVVYACTDELHQLLVADRAGMWQDVLLDGCGVLAGITCAYALLVLIWRAAEKWGGCIRDDA